MLEPVPIALIDIKGSNIQINKRIKEENAIRAISDSLVEEL